MDRADTVIIIGATSIIARHLAWEFAVRDYNLLLVGRNSEELDAVRSDLEIRCGAVAETCLFDASHKGALPPLIHRVGELAKVKSVQGIVVALGYQGTQTTAEADPCEARRVMDINFTAVATLISQLLGFIDETRRRSFVCVLSSVAGDRGRQSNYIYGASKAALGVYLQGVRNRLQVEGRKTRVVTVKLGLVDTRMTFGRKRSLLMASPERAARDIYRAISHKKKVAYVPWYWRWIMLLIRLMPEGLFNRLRL